jgi:hypothetical protein
MAAALLVGPVPFAHGAPAFEAHARTIATLVTGERVALSRSPAGTPTAQILRAANDGPASQLKVVLMNGHVFAIPASAMAYFGRFLDPSLFDATAIADAGFGDRIPLKITYTGSLPALPGITITSKNGASARGYVTRTSAKTFGAALAKQAISDAQTGWPASVDLFGSITSIATVLAGSPTVTPQFPMSTLVIKGTAVGGNKMRFAFGELFNMDDGRKFGGFVILFKGEARASVPIGTYAAIFDDMTFSTDGSLTVRENVVSDFAVTGSQPAMKIDSRRATAVPSLVTPKPALPEQLGTTVDFRDERGRSSFSSGWTIGLPGASIRFTPMDEPTVGTAGFETRWLAYDTATPGGAYSFDANAKWPGIPVDMAQMLGPVRDAMAVDNTYYASSSFQVGGTARFVFMPGSFFAFASFQPTPMPLHRIDYVYAPPRTHIEDTALADYFAWDPGFVDGPYLTVAAGSTDTERWFRNPYTLDVPQVDPTARFVPCIYCASDAKMAFLFNVHDGDPRHFVEVFAGPTRAPVAQFRVFRNDTLLLRKDDRLGLIFKIPSGPAKYRISEQLTRRWTGSWLSTDVRTDVIFNSKWGVPAPSNWYCYPGAPCSRRRSTCTPPREARSLSDRRRSICRPGTWRASRVSRSRTLRSRCVEPERPRGCPWQPRRWAPARIGSTSSRRTGWRIGASTCA